MNIVKVKFLRDITSRRFFIKRYHYELGEEIEMQLTSTFDIKTGWPMYRFIDYNARRDGPSPVLVGCLDVKEIETADLITDDLITDSFIWSALGRDFL